MKIEGLKLDCHQCSRSIYVDKNLIGLINCCPFCFDPEIVAYNKANIYIGKLLEDYD